MSSGGDSIRMCGFSAFFRCGMQYLDTIKVPRVLMPIIRSNRFMSVACEFVRLMALALLTQTSMPPNSAAVLSIAAITCASSRMSQSIGRALPPAARSAIASPMPRLAPEMNSVLPLSDVIGDLRLVSVLRSLQPPCAHAGDNSSHPVFLLGLYCPAASAPRVLGSGAPTVPFEVMAIELAEPCAIGPTT